MANLGSEYLEKQIEILDQQRLITERIKGFDVFQHTSYYNQGKFFIANKNEEKSKLYFHHEVSYHGKDELSYLIRANEAKYIYVEKQKIAIIENSDVLYFYEKTDTYYRKSNISYVNPNCANFLTIFNRSNQKLKLALDNMNTIPAIQSNGHLLPDWAKDYLMLK